MIAKLTKNVPTFSPFTITLTIQTIEELGCFIDLVNNPAGVAEAVNGSNSTTQDMCNFIDEMAPYAMFDELCLMYGNVLESNFN